MKLPTLRTILRGAGVGAIATAPTLPELYTQIGTAILGLILFFVKDVLDEPQRTKRN